MRSKKTKRKSKYTREETLAWSREGEPAPSVLAWGAEPSAAITHAAAVLVGFPAPQCVATIAARLCRIEAALGATNGASKLRCA